MRWIVAMALTAALAQPAAALSCAAPDITRDYAKAANSDEVFILVKGDLHFDESALPGKSGNRAAHQPDSVDIQAWLSGQSLTRDGFTKPFERDVILRVSCLGMWCGGTANGPHLAFLKQDGRQWILQLGPCPGMTYPDPDPKQLETVQACFDGAPCGEG